MKAPTDQNLGEVEEEGSESRQGIMIGDDNYTLGF